MNTNKYHLRSEYSPCMQAVFSLAIILLTILSFISCKKEDSHPFDTSPTDRMTELLDQYQNTFVNAPNGWRATIFPDSGKGGGFTFYFRFTNDNRVSMLSDIASSTLTQFFESSYRMKGLQQPALIFDTYSYLHILSDPNNEINGGIRGRGLLSDFEFAVDTVTADSVKLTGRFNGSKAFMVPASQAEAQNFASYFGTATDLEFIGNLTTYFKRLVLGSNQFEISINQSIRTITLSWLENNVVQTFTTAYYYSANAVVFVTPLFVNGVNITGFTNVHYNAAENVIDVTAAGTNGQIQTATSPLVVDVNAPRTWYQAALQQDTYWYSPTGFTVEGQPDAFGITTIPNFFYLIFWPQFGGNYDLAAGFVTLENGSLKLPFGLATRSLPTFTSDGRVIFPALGIVGTVPVQYESIFNNTAAQMVDSRGYYLIQTGPTSYDMVSARDAKAWISWRF